MKKLLVALMLVLCPGISLSQTTRLPFEIGVGVVKQPVRMATWNSRLYVCDTGLKSVLCFDDLGKLVFKTQDGDLESPTGIDVTADGQVIVTDSVKKSVYIYSSNLDSPRYLKFPDKAKLEEPYDLCIDGTGLLNVLDRATRTVYLIGLTGRYYGQYCTAGLGTNQLAWPVAIASSGQEIVINDAGAGKLVFFSNAHKETRRLGTKGSDPLSVRFPTDSAWDKAGNLYVTDKLLSDVMILPATRTNPFSYGMYGRKGSFTNLFYSDVEPGMTKQDSRGYLNQPESVVIGNGCVYIADTGNGRIVFEDIKTVLEQPRCSYTPFVATATDIPVMFTDPQLVDFGQVKPGILYTKKLTITIPSNGYARGRVSISGNYYNVEPKYFVGSRVTLYITHKTESTGSNFANLAIELGAARLDISIRANCVKAPGIRFLDSDSRQVVVGTSPVQANLKLELDKGYSGKVNLTCSKITYKTPWSKVARGVDEMVLTTLDCQPEPTTLDSAGENSVRVVFTPVGNIRPGVYSTTVEVRSADGTLLASEGITFSVAYPYLENSATQLLENFTAHWCEPCGFQREAQYRIFAEYGPRAFMPVAYYVMDDADLELTGFTRPDNYERFLMYEGQGVPVNVIDGEMQKMPDNGKQLAHDRIRGRKYSGSTQEYLKLRGDFDLSPHRLGYHMNIWSSFDQKAGSVKVEIPDYDFEKNTENELVLLLTEDDIEYSSSNGEDSHHFVVRTIISKHMTSTQKAGSFLLVNFEIPKMPSGFEVRPDHCRVVGFLQNKKTLKVSAVGWCIPDNKLIAEPIVFFDSKQSSISANSLVPVNIIISNTSDKWKKFNIKLTLPEGFKIVSEQDYITAGSSSPVVYKISIDSSKVFSITQPVPLIVDLEDDDGQKYSSRLVLPTVITNIQ